MEPGSNFLLHVGSFLFTPNSFVPNSFRCCRAQVTKTYYNSKDEVLQLWCHETCRIIADRMWDAADKTWLQKQLNEVRTSALHIS